MVKGMLTEVLAQQTPGRCLQGGKVVSPEVFTLDLLHLSSMGTQTKPREIEFSMPVSDGLSMACYAQPSLGPGTPCDLLKAAVEKHLPEKSKQNTSVGAPGERQGKCGTNSHQAEPAPGRVPVEESRSEEPLPAADGQEVGKY